jgi:hypothetical protein
VLSAEPVTAIVLVAEGEKGRRRVSYEIEWLGSKADLIVLRSCCEFQSRFRVVLRNKDVESKVCDVIMIGQCKFALSFVSVQSIIVFPDPIGSLRW